MSTSRRQARWWIWVGVSGAMGLLSLLVLACRSAGDYRVPLPRGYYLDRLYGDMIVMGGPDNQVILDARIDGYKVYPGVVVGSASQAALGSEPGYFALDLTTGRMRQGLSRASWLALLRSYGIATPPALYKPSMWDKELGHNRPDRREGER